MKLIIDIPEVAYEDAKREAGWMKPNDTLLVELKLAVADGTPLPKEHGRLIDCSAAIADIYEEYMSSDMTLANKTARMCIKILQEVPTIVEAEEGEE